VLFILKGVQMIKLFSSESVTEGHPDKICDQISDAVLDAYLSQDPYSRVACETAVTTNYVLVFGEITSKGTVDIEHVVRQTIKNIGYDDESIGFDYKTAHIDVRVNEQSPDIALGVDEKENRELGAGDQGMMFGYANKDTESLMPLPIDLSHRLAERLSYVRKHHIVEGLYPDGKTQVTVAYEGQTPLYIDHVVLSTQHKASWDQKALRDVLIKEVIQPVLEGFDTSQTTYLINPTGKFVVGGPNADSGLTGRKIIVDTYGGFAPHGGGAFSGKDATKVDRSAAYMARFIAKHVVAADFCDVCELEIAYAIGVSEPVSFFVDCHGTEKVDLKTIAQAIKETFDLRPSHIIDVLQLRLPVFSKTSAYGHFGNKDVTWEKLPFIEKLKQNVYNKIGD
jgi:S-adenosylmethionine synthetase